MTISNKLNNFLAEYPFLTVATYGKNEYLGIIQNQDANLISMYIYDEIKDSEMRRLFLKYGAEWWWETNRLIPINIILGSQFEPYYSCLRTFNIKDFDIVAGPSVCLRDIMKKRVKRKNVQLIRKVN